MDKVTPPQDADQQYARKLTKLRRAIQEGIDSGVNDRTVEQIWAETKAKYLARRL